MKKFLVSTNYEHLPRNLREFRVLEKSGLLQIENDIRFNLKIENNWLICNIQTLDLKDANK